MTSSSDAAERDPRGAGTPREIPLGPNEVRPRSFGVDALGRVHALTLDVHAYRLDPA